MLISLGRKWVAIAVSTSELTSARMISLHRLPVSRRLSVNLGIQLRQLDATFALRQRRWERHSRGIPVFSRKGISSCTSPLGFMGCGRVCSSDLRKWRKPALESSVWNVGLATDTSIVRCPSFLLGLTLAQIPCLGTRIRERISR